MREIKFRAWDKINKKMIYGPTPDSLSSSWILALPDEGFVKMQYTGRKDIDRKEVYDGDILNDSILPGIIESQGYIKWSNEDSCFKFMPIFDSDPNLCLKHGYLLSEMPTSAIHDMRLIGNIYETPKFLSELKVTPGGISITPELLEVYRATKEFSDYHAGDRDFNFTYGESFNPVLAAIKKIDEQ